MTPAQKAVAVELAGSTLLGLSMTRTPGSPSFYALTLCLAGTWTVGSRGDGDRRPRTLTRPASVPALVGPAAVGAVAFGGFAALSRVARRIPVLDRAVADALSYRERGSTALVLTTTCANAVAEEMFFRGQLWSLMRARNPVLATTGAYTAMAASTRNPALVAAAAVMGTLFGWQRKRTGGIQAPVVTHLTWSALMVTLLPRMRRT